MKVKDRDEGFVDVGDSSDEEMDVMDEEEETEEGM